MADAHLHRISRRRMLKRIGAAGTVAWAVPVIATVGTPAWAGSLCPDCSPACGDNHSRCENPGNDPCICARRHEGGCACVEWDGPFRCGPCLTDADCGPDVFCIDIVPPCPCTEKTMCRARCPFSYAQIPQKR
jgi:hypothetical protein